MQQLNTSVNLRVLMSRSKGSAFMNVLFSSWILGLISGWVTLWIGGADVPVWFRKFTWVSTAVFLMYLMFQFI
jgi:hypothetical protein